MSSQKLNINSSEIIPGENPGSPQVSHAVKQLNRLYYGSNITQSLHSKPPIDLEASTKLDPDDKLHEKCGVFGVYKFNQSIPDNSLGDVFKKTLTGLLGLQHRGQEATGIATFTNNDLKISKGSGTVSDFFKKNPFFEAIKRTTIQFMERLGLSTFTRSTFNDTFEEYSKDFSAHNYAQKAIGHVLYATSKAGAKVHAQPIKEGEPPFVLVHNGNLPDVDNLRTFLLKKGHPENILNESNDSELMAKTIAQFQKDILEERAKIASNIQNNEDTALEEAIKKAAPMFKGAYSLIIMNKDEMIALRDPKGIRPFSMGSLANNQGVVFSSEDSAFSKINAKAIRDIKPGEMIVIKQGTNIQQLQNPQEIIFNQNDVKPHIDAFEFVYFARPDSVIEGKSVYEARSNMGIETAKEFLHEIQSENQVQNKSLSWNPENTVVVPVYESGKHAAHSLANELKLPIVAGLMKNIARRTFIDGGAGIDDKFSVIAEAVKGKDLLVVDDSIVRGNTSKVIINKLREAGAKSVTLISTAPPVLYPDFYGIDTPDQDKLVAAKALKDNPNASPKELNQAIAKELGADKVFYLSLNGLVKAIDIKKDKLNLAAFNGEYPVELGKKSESVQQYATIG
ncbi:MAG: amidophosphoribosyltransferase [Candidatus Melainabacteria bacterium]|nr:amidophosphoribosyltransferase [Candidatus Melainabacteria bacterium]